MERAEFIVDTEKWKTFYRMRYNGNKEKLLKFAFLVDGTAHIEIGKIFPELSEKAKEISERVKGKELLEVLREIKKEAKRTKLGKLAEMWLLREVLALLGLKTYPDAREIKKILKEI